MQIRNLTLTHIRTFSYAEITFQPGMNLIVGINGVGKSTILDTLRILISQILTHLSKSRSKALDFEIADISINQPSLTAELTFEVADTEFHYLVHQPREPYITNPNPMGQIRDQTSAAVERRVLTLNSPDIPKSLKKSAQQTLAVYFSPRRALANISTKYTTHGKNAAFADALVHRELRLMEFADWWLAQKTLATENAPNAQRHLDVLAVAISSILDTCTNIRADRETFSHIDKKGKSTPRTNTTLLIDKAGVTLDLRQLSDGERGILALALDLARRLSQANPHLEDPLQAAAVVLIDELDLHLHPQWQHTIVTKLTATFPNCQFIATTHSPLIIGEVPPENIILLETGHLPFRPDQSLGMDTDWILKYLMGTTTRNPQTEAELKHIANFIETEDYDEALDAIDTLRDQIGEFPELIRLQTRIDRFQMLGE
jgi:energy-coupling factor transporter ATP-binding protein EcfA2